MPGASRRATLDDVHHLAMAMPDVALEHGPAGNAIYQVARKSFIFFRNPRPDAVDPATGDRYTDVIVFWVDSEIAKRALVEGDTTPFFTTPHFEGHPSVLVRGCRIGELNYDELAEVVQDAWLSRAPKHRGQVWLRDHLSAS